MCQSRFAAARGAFPGQATPDHDPLSHLELVRNADVLVVAPASYPLPRTVPTSLAKETP